MDFLSLSAAIEKFIRNGHLPAFLTGAVGGGLLVLSMMKLLLARDPRRGATRILEERNADLERKLEEREARAARDLAARDERIPAIERESRVWETRAVELSASRDEARLDKVALSSECERLKIEAHEAAERAKLERLARRNAEERAASADRELDGLLKSDAKTWDRPVARDAPPFRPLSLRSTPIVSVVNLKGGVGKTTITANLGFALARRGCRVLLVDLDYQGSLTSRCASRPELEDILDSRRVVAEVLGDDAGDRAAALRKNATRLADAQGGGEVHLVGADDAFERVEAELMMRWHVGGLEDDVRFRLREALHAPGLDDRFDIVLLDCPPRFTTGCINALTASDHALIPVLLDEASAEAVPRLLKWLKALRPGVFPDLSVLGVVGNKAFPRTRLVARERAVWGALAGNCEAAWGRPVRLFDEAIIRQHSTPEHRIPALCPRHGERYLNLADCLLKELRPHVRRRTPGLPPFAGATAQGVGS